MAPPSIPARAASTVPALCRGLYKRANLAGGCQLALLRLFNISKHSCTISSCITTSTPLVPFLFGIGRRHPRLLVADLSRSVNPSRATAPRSMIGKHPGNNDAPDTAIHIIKHGDPVPTATCAFSRSTTLNYCIQPRCRDWTGQAGLRPSGLEQTAARVYS